MPCVSISFDGTQASNAHESDVFDIINKATEGTDQEPIYSTAYPPLIGGLDLPQEAIGKLEALDGVKVQVMTDSSLMGLVRQAVVDPRITLADDKSIAEDSRKGGACFEYARYGGEKWIRLRQERKDRGVSHSSRKE